MNRTYPWQAGEERLRTQGEDLPVQVLILPALFDEANRMRRFTVQLMHRLVEHGIGSLLPDLPGTGESILDLADVNWSDWAEAVRIVSDRLPPGERLSVAIRGGSLLDRFVGDRPGVSHRAWQISPETGQRILLGVRRAMKLAGSSVPGYVMSERLETPLSRAVPGVADRVVRLASDSAEAHHHIAAPPLWRRAEPSEDLDLVEQVAADIAAWVRR